MVYRLLKMVNLSMAMLNNQMVYTILPIEFYMWYKYIFNKECTCMYVLDHMHIYI